MKKAIISITILLGIVLINGCAVKTHTAKHMSDNKDAWIYMNATDEGVFSDSNKKNMYYCNAKDKPVCTEAKTIFK